MKLDPNALHRRDCLKASTLLVASSALPACSDREASSPSTGLPPDDLYERGATPIQSSGWAHPQPATAIDYPMLTQTRHSDVVVVGAGLAGSSLAYHLSLQGIDVTVLEARQPGWGASGRNAGHVLPSLRDLTVFRQFPDGGERFLAAFRDHHNLPFELARELQIDCDAAATGYLNAITGERTFEALKQQARFWIDQQGQQVDFLDQAQVSTMTGSQRFSHGIYYRAGGRINPYRFTNGLAHAALQRGAHIFGHSEALELLPEGNRWQVRTAHGAVTADKVIFCTNAYPTGVIPAFQHCFYPLTAYGLSTKPLPESVREQILPTRATLAQMPVDLNPMVIDEHHRMILSSIPSSSAPDDASWHFAQHLRWLQRTWPVLREVEIELEHYWTGRVGLRDQEFPGVFEVHNGVFGLMHFNAWGNLMAPLLGKLFAEFIANGDPATLAFPLSRPEPVAYPGKQELIIRKLLIPAARFGQRLGFL